MQQATFAVADIGSNTAHLLVARMDGREIIAVADVSVGLNLGGILRFLQRFWRNPWDFVSKCNRNRQTECNPNKSKVFHEAYIRSRSNHSFARLREHNFVTYKFHFRLILKRLKSKS